MDVIINSLVQSPLARTLGNIKTKADTFTHNVKDNVPACSFSKIIVASDRGTNGTMGQTFTHSIPQFGYLTKAVLRCTYRLTDAQQSASWATASGSGLFIDRATLRTHNRIIQTMYGDETDARVCRLSRANERERARSAMSDVPAWNGSAASGLLERTSYFPLFLASTDCPASNFNTRFVEDMQIVVDTFTPSQVTNNGTAIPLRTDLILYYTNFHDRIETNIRNMNYQEGVPATVLARDTILQAPFLSNQNFSGKVVRTAAATPAAENLYTDTIDIRSNNLAYGLTVVLRSLHTVAGVATPRRPINIGIERVQLTGSGQTLYDSSNYKETHKVDKWDHRLAAGADSDMRLTPYMAGNELRDHALYVPLSYSGDETYFSGGIALQTVNNPQLLVTTSYNGGVNLDSDVAANYAIDVYVHHFAMVRIDSGNGVITRSLDI
jgi:hypothetical protein